MAVNLILSLLLLSSGTLNQTLKNLDNLIENRPVYWAKKEALIDSLKSQLHPIDSSNTIELERAYDICNKIEENYRKLNLDSCFVYNSHKRRIARKLDNPFYICASDLNFAESYVNSGLFAQSEEILAKYKEDEVHEILRPYYYHIKRRLHEYYIDQAVLEEDKLKYKEILQDLYLKSIEIPLIKVNYLIGKSQYDRAEQIIIDEIDNNRADMAYFAYLYSKIYEARGDAYNQALYLSLSAINDLEQGVREHKSLYELAFCLYEHGDTRRAYHYLKTAMADASLCNARLRYIESSTFFNIIDQSYFELDRHRRKNIILSLILTGVLAFTLIVLLCLIVKRTIKLNSIRKELTHSNKVLAETAAIKEEYIALYMDQCSNYIFRFDSYRKKLRKLLIVGDNTGLEKEIKSSGQVEQELAEFYANFDQAFLNIFPNFVREFNNLITEPQIPAKEKSLTPELRIYALIRLGIYDSARISKFLRYSLSTIYNYRTKMRNKAKGARSDFENQVKLIGKARRQTE